MISLALAYLKTDRNEPAKEVLTEVIRTRPDNGLAYQNLGYCYLRLGDVNSAIESYSSAVKINDRDWQAFRGLGVAYMVKALHNKDDILREKAVQQWRMSLQINPSQDRREKLIGLIRKHSE
jgi:tetratricopeptide (TPR) repeat protein